MTAHIATPTAPIRTPAEKIALAKRRISYLRANAFRAYLGEDGALLVSDTSGNGRDVTKHAPTLFNDIVAGLAEDPELLGEKQAK